MKKILIIRKFDDFSRILTENGFEIINLPLTETKPLENLRDLEEKLKTLENYDGIFLTSQNAAQILAAKLDELKINFSGKIYVLGRRSFEILNSKNLDLVFFENAENVAEMLEKIPAEQLRDRNFLFVRGEKSLKTIPNYVKSLAAIDETIVYANQAVFASAEKKAAIIDLINKAEIEAICFFSPSAAESFCKQFGAEILHQTKIATIGKTTAEFFERRNLKTAFVSPKSSAEGFALGLIEYLRNGK